MANGEQNAAFSATGGARCGLCCAKGDSRVNGDESKLEVGESKDRVTFRLGSVVIRGVSPSSPRRHEAPLDTAPHGKWWTGMRSGEEHLFDVAIAGWLMTFMQGLGTVWSSSHALAGSIPMTCVDLWLSRMQA